MRDKLNMQYFYQTMKNKNIDSCNQNGVALIPMKVCGKIIYFEKQFFKEIPLDYTI